MPLPRKLEYKDRFVYHIVRQINGDCDGEPIVFPDNTTPIKFVVEMSLNEFTEVLSALYTGADLSYPEKSHQVVWNFLKQVECPVSICDEILACLQPAFDEINEQLGEITADIEQVNQTLLENATQERALTQSTVENEICGGANAIVDAMYQVFVNTYEATEAAPLDNFAEFVVAFLQAVPIISELPFDNMIAAVNWYFENQFLDFQTDFDAVRDNLVCDLKCFVEANGNIFDWDLWANWLEYVGETYPSNRAAQGFARYSPYRQTWVNQIAALINRDASLQSYFDTLAVTWESGLLNPMSCALCDCSTVTWCKTWELPLGMQGWQIYSGNGTFIPGVGVSGASTPTIWLYREDFGNRRITSIRTVTDGGTPLSQAGTPYDTLTTLVGELSGTTENIIDVSADPGFASIANMAVRAGVNPPAPGNFGHNLIEIEVCGLGIEPEWDE